MDEDMQAKVKAYAERGARKIADADLGAGIHGIVVLLEDEVQPGFSVLKMHFERGSYLRERDAYLHLRGHQWVRVCGCEIPELLTWNDTELALEMSFVRPPFVLDFGQTYLFLAPDFPDGVWEATYEKWREQFGSDWERVTAILAEFEGIDMYMLDPNPENFRFR